MRLMRFTNSAYCTRRVRFKFVQLKISIFIKIGDMFRKVILLVEYIRVAAEDNVLTRLSKLAITRRCVSRRFF